MKQTNRRVFMMQVALGSTALAVNSEIGTVLITDSGVSFGFVVIN